MPASQSDNKKPNNGFNNVPFNYTLKDGTVVKSVADVNKLDNSELVDLNDQVSQNEIQNPGSATFIAQRDQITKAFSNSPLLNHDVRTNASTASDLSKSQNGVSNPSSANKPGIQVNNGQDYTDREQIVNSNAAMRKVSLVGNYGKGVRPLTGGGPLGSTGTDGGLSGSTHATSNQKSIVVFESSPDLSESGTTVLIDIGDIRAAASVVIYMGSPSRSFNITARFISQTTAAATKTQNDINILKAWRMPMLSKGAGFNAEPETLRLFAYGNSLKGIPVMIQSLNIEYPSDMDYVPASDGTPVPIIQTVSISLKEVRSIDDLKTFSYEDFKQGKLPEW